MNHEFTNELIHESSPYLLQHAHNPVHWAAWSETSWKKARDENKLVIVSIGYSACHWCHVMEHESFEDVEVAKIMNQGFICIKVDREERPDVDQIYMDAVQLISGRGGWPLNAIVLPDGRPIYAGTYFQKEHWKQVLKYFVDYWQNQRQEAFQRAAEITKGILQMDGFQKPVDEVLFEEAHRVEIFKKMEATWDFEKGGRKGAPKFPMPVNMQYLLRNYFYTKNERALKAVTITLNNMMNGGLYDQIGGGFARYSVDEDWTIPHFEKMLYDNAQLVSLYAEAYQITKEERYKQTVYDTLDFIERELSDASGGFYAALDADSEGEEGKYYVWDYAELQSILKDDLEAFQQIFEISSEGNFEGKNNLTRKHNRASDAGKLKQWKLNLLDVRSKRVKPSLDDKILTSWNALMLKGFVDAYNAFGEKKFLERACASAVFLKEKMILNDFSIKRNYKNDKATISGFLDDYSFTCEAFLALYYASFNEEWLFLAKHIATYVEQHFYNTNTGMFFYTSVNDEPLIARKSEMSDNVIPASNSSMAKVMYQIGLIFEQENYIQISKRALQNMQANIMNHPSYYANWAMLMDWFLEEPFQVAIVGSKALLFKKEFDKTFYPNCIFMGTMKDTTAVPLLQGKLNLPETNIYICRNKTCGLAVNNVSSALTQLAK